jgi:K+/H+ antiporter YhaU regulatory subunit KhtT
VIILAPHLAAESRARQRSMKFLPSQLAYLLSQREAQVPRQLVGKTLGQSAIGAQTGLNVIGLHRTGKRVSTIAPGTKLASGSELVMIGSSEQRQQFHDLFR